MSEHKGKALNPWARVELLNRAIAGENRRVLEQDYGVHRATINRWVARWRRERPPSVVGVNKLATR